ncbi:MAG: hypothetical protein EBS98_08680 [Chitinophagia bacterium]|nr:hypothetical protein [Chitinophagia bacterium]
MRLNKFRTDYWSCSKIADLIRGSAKPFALEWDEWDKWDKHSKTKHPVRYWIAETLLKKLQDIVHFPFDVYHTISIYIRNRYISKIHYLKTGLKPGEYFDLDTRIFHALFNELVIFVEKEATIEHLTWASNLVYDEDYGVDSSYEHYGKLTHQAEASLKILELYHWWKNRDYRPDPHKIFSKETHGKDYYKTIAEIEDSYDKEDDEILLELVKIRRELWT